MNNISDYKINADGFMEQSTGNCPQCGSELIWDNIVGWGDYPLGGFRSRMKPNSMYGLGYKCTDCGTASIHHQTMEYITDAIEYLIHYNMIQH